MIPDVLVWVLVLAAGAYTVQTVLEIYFMVRDYQQSKKEPPKNQGLSAYF